MNDYDRDLNAWSSAQADALRRRATNEIDYENIAQEIEAVGQSQRDQIESRLENLLIHLLKWYYQPEKQSNSWLASIDEARKRIKRVLVKNPSLKTYPSECLADVYQFAIRSKVIRHLELLHLPNECKWSITEILDDEFLP